MDATTFTPETLAERVKAELADSGICWVRQDVEPAQFRESCERLGSIVYEADITMGASRPRNYQLPAAIDFHTDHVCAEIVAWHCLSIEPGRGAMQFLDLAPIGESIGAERAAALGRVGVADNAAWGGGQPIPLALPRNGGLRYHYVPWLRKFTQDPAAQEALEAFEERFNACKKDAYVEVDIAPGQCVFLDNHRVAHGRGPISPDSPRNLKRLWINSQGESLKPR